MTEAPHSAGLRRLEEERRVVKDSLRQIQADFELEDRDALINACHRDVRQLDEDLAVLANHHRLKAATDKAAVLDQYMRQALVSALHRADEEAAGDIAAQVRRERAEGLQKLLWRYRHQLITAIAGNAVPTRRAG